MLRVKWEYKTGEDVLEINQSWSTIIFAEDAVSFV